jgi:predicted metal-dependent hydrolase
MFSRTFPIDNIPNRHNYYFGVSSLTAKDLGYRWGFLLKRRQAGFPLEVYDGPPKIIDYIIVHELCHLHHRDHTDAFWNEVDKVLPDYRERKESLRNNEAKFDL